MPTKQKTKKKTSLTKVVTCALVSLVVIALTYFLTKYFMQAQADQRLLNEQTVRLDAAEKDIKKVAEDFLANFSMSEVSTKEFKKECGESSAKYGGGTISCRPSFFARILSSETPEQLVDYETKLQDSIDATGSFTSKKEPFVRTSSARDNRLFEIVTTYDDSEKTDCYFTINIYTAEQYISEHEEDPRGANVMTVSALCREITKEPIYPLRG